MKTRKTVGARIVAGLEEEVACQRGILPGVRVARVRPALRLLQVAERHPQAIVEHVSQRSA